MVGVPVGWEKCVCPRKTGCFSKVACILGFEQGESGVCKPLRHMPELLSQNASLYGVPGGWGECILSQDGSVLRISSQYSKIPVDGR